ncbi:helix-turn-helix transcriptional regulator [Geobacillus sp. C56-T3]|uniref:helix-turn-helix domain-containing protein n=1 Tax=Geobacillus sp. (strain C56-T3) TaxID=691437 RepID=UPI0001D585A1|nr:helix-turn-helix transcriptional regulator [Geobacillus sp. C56-T3]ADI25700.1 transcriptional regulator, XRE family [Geobacillus sp. C56-T3]
MKLGDRLKFARLMKGLTQEETAEGIISVSYLSKIENNQVIPSQEVLEWLFRRLDIRPGGNETMPSWFEWVMSWYKAMTNRDVPAAREMYETVKERCEQSGDAEAMIYFQLMRIRYLLLLGDKKGAETAAQSVRDWYGSLSDDMRYYYWKFFGLLYYCQEKYDDALHCCKKAEELLKGEWKTSGEEADLAYLSALACSRLWKWFQCLHYAERALTLSQAEYDLRRSAECHVLLAICYRRCGEIDKAVDHCLLAQKAARMVDDRRLLGIVEHNLGHLKGMKRQYREAVQHYENSLIYKEDAPLDARLITLLSLVRVHCDAKHYRKASMAVEEGWKQLEQAPNGASEHYEYYLHFSIYRLLLSEEDEPLERLLKQEAIPYFQKKKEYDDASLYAEYLADCYMRRRQYKQAAQYYQLSCSLLRTQTGV